MTPRYGADEKPVKAKLGHSPQEDVALRGQSTAQRLVPAGRPEKAVGSAAGL